MASDHTLNNKITGLTLLFWMRILWKFIIFIGMSLCCVAKAMAWDVSAYAGTSVLAYGKWVKISVPSTGFYRITPDMLSAWGFTNASRARVYGYGARRIGNVLSVNEYVDDLPLAPQRHTTAGLVFYAQGPDTPAISAHGNRYEDLNIYSAAAYYFITDNGDADLSAAEKALDNAISHWNASPLTMHHEIDRTSPGEAGWLLVGEDFKPRQSHTFTFKAPDTTGSATVECGIVSDSDNDASVEIVINGKKVEESGGYRLPATNRSTYLHGSYTLLSHKFSYDTESIEIRVSVPGAAAMHACWLDYIALSFDCRNAEFSLADGASLPAPEFVAEVPNQNLHSLEPAEMVIFTLPAWKDQAERIATLHREAKRPLSVAVIDVNEVYNEFASGCPDVSALRRCLKMLYDRGAGSLKYALLMGRSTYDNRHLTPQFDNIATPATIPCWMGGQRAAQLNDNTAFGTDDFIAMLADGSGTNLGLDDICIAVGRMPVRNHDEAKSAVDKLMQYAQKSPHGAWRNNMLIVADDGDDGVHALQAEKIAAEALAPPYAPTFATKVYVDAYDIAGGVCADGHDRMLRALNEGAAWWIYCGHANNHSWTSEGLLTYTDINKNLFLPRVPVLMAATCDFLRWDSSTLSGGEILFHTRYGGTIATISATRPVYITDNGLFSAAIARAINRRDADGCMPRLGDVYRNAKNDITNPDGIRQANTNRLRYVLMGDPAMEIVTPSNLAQIDSIDGQSVDTDNQICLKALQRAKISGSITDPRGNLIPDFNGTVEICIYDADKTATTKGLREGNVQINFDQHGDQLFAGTTAVENGRFTITAAMPEEIADNFRPATITLAAYSATDNAAGIYRDFYVYGTDYSSMPDSIAPVIHSFFLNHESFSPGDFVNTSPMAIAYVSDDVALNLSTGGLGRRMTLTLDGSRTFTDVALYFTPADGEPAGAIHYPLNDLAPGPHTLHLRVWDTSGNAASQQLAFNAATDLPPNIYDIYCEGGTAHTDANFYITHDRPDRDLTVSVSVYSISGRKVWEGLATGRSDRFSSMPVTWNLTTIDGRRAPQGVYVYRAIIKEAGGDAYRTDARKMVVTNF